MDLLIPTLTFCTCLVASHYILDKFITFRSPNTKYFLLHFFVNMYIVKLILPDVKDTVLDPITPQPTSIYPSLLTVMFHTYHVVFYNDIARDEKIHHLVNVYVTSPLLWYSYNKLCNYALFYLMGLPGGITYLLLFLKDNNIINSLTEKNISKHLNLWVRCPGAITVVYTIYIQMLYNIDTYKGLTFLIGLISIIGTYWNGIYFMQTIVESHTRKLTETRLGSKTLSFGPSVDLAQSDSVNICVKNNDIDNLVLKPSDLRKRKSTLPPGRYFNQSRDYSHQE